MINRFFLLAFLLLAFSGRAVAMASEAEIKRVYLRGVDGDQAAVNDCIARTESLLRAKPQDHLARAYLGSALILRSRDLPIGSAKLDALREGLRQLDTAVAAAPDNPRVRLLRAFTQQPLPFFIGRRAAAREDFRVLVQLAEKDRSALSDSDLQLVYFNAGAIEEAAGDPAHARKLFRRATRYPVDPKITAKINRALAKYSDAR